MLKAQDIVILLKILSTMTLAKRPPDELSQNELALLLGMSASEVNAGTKRLFRSGLLGLPLKKVGSTKKRILLPVKSACEECLISGVKYFFPVQLGAYTRGIATRYAAPILEKQIMRGQDPIPVWPYAEGKELGLALEPLYRSVPKSLAQYPDQRFYDLLALIDAIRGGEARERKIAIKLLREMLNEQ